MQFDRQQWKCLAAMAATWMCAAGALQAQSLVVTAGNIIATDTDVAPGCGGATFGGSSALVSAPSLGINGNVVFRARITGAGVTPLNERALFFGSTRANLQLAIRSGDQAPGLAPGITIQTSFGTTGIDGTPRISENGTYYLFGTSLWNGGVVAANDTALYSGTLGSYSLLAREGDPAPGTAGATLSGTFSSTSAQSSGINDSGTCFFQSALTGGDVAGTTNNAAWYIGTPGSLQIALRKGDAINGGAQVVSALGFISQINASGQFVHEDTLSTTLGTNPATAANDKVLQIYTPGPGNQVIVREGDPAPGTGGGTFSLPANSWTFNNGGNCFNASGQTVSRLDVTGGTTSSGVFIMSASGVTPVALLGDVAPGTGGATFNVFNNSSCQINNAGQVAFQASLAGAGVTSANDTAVFVGAPGSLQLAVREGDAVPGSGGTLFFDNVSSVSMSLNGLGQILWSASLIPGSTNAAWSWDSGYGLREIVRSGDSIEVQTGVFKTVTGALSSTGAFNNSNGTALNFSNDRVVAGSVGFLDGTRALFTVTVPHLPLPVSYCTAGTTTNGCNALISATAQPSVSLANPCVINTTGVEGNRSGITFYGLSASGVLWCPAGSSYLCVKAPTQRMTVQSTGGTDGLCDGALSDDWNAYQLSNPAALGNPWSAGDDIFVQAWFRDPPACKTTSLSNALKLTYQP